MTASRAGAKFETDVLQYIRDQGYSAERLAKAGKNDEGDIVLGPASGHPVVFEAKVRRDKTTGLSLGTFMVEASKEAERYGRARLLRSDPMAAVVLKKVQASIADSYVVLRLEDFLKMWSGHE